MGRANIKYFFFFFYLLADSCPAHAIPPDAIKSSEEQVKASVQKSISEEKAHEPRVKAILESANRDARSGNYEGLQSARKHPWLEANPAVGANPASEIDYEIDSLVAAGGIIGGRFSPFLLQNWSCFEPRLLSFGRNNPGGAPEIVPEFSDLGQVCARSCFDLPYWPPVFPFPFCIGGLGIGLVNGWAFDGCGSILADDEFEVIEYWWPEHQVSLNNYGISRLDPTQQADLKGALFARQSLLASKRANEEGLLKAASVAYPGNFSDTSYLEGLRAHDDMMGQTMWGGFYNPDFQDRVHAHGYRTRIAYRTADKRPGFAPAGWALEPRSVYHSFPPPSALKHILNGWTEAGALEALTSVPELSAQIPGRIRTGMRSLYGTPATEQQKAKQAEPFWQSTGAMSYRVATWPQIYGDLANVLQVKGNPGAPMLNEIVYKGGHELFPLVLSLPGFGSSYISSMAIMARRAFFIMGARETLPYLLGFELSRMNEYTIDGIDRSREIDKMSWIGRPLVMSFLYGIPPSHPVMTSECFRSQKIPNSVEQNTVPWYDFNLPKTAQNYVKYDFNDSAFVYWNKRVACTCKYLGLPFGAWAMDFPFDFFGLGRGTGDRPYGHHELPLCSYLPGTYPQAFGGKESERCIGSPPIFPYFGLTDTK